MFNSFYLSELILYFTIYSFLGWFLEVLYVSYQSKKLVNRGFLFGPFCPIYGFGVVSLIFFLQPISSHPLLFFVGAIIITSLIEYLTGFFLELIFKANWWDYSDEKYNLNGKICLKFSLYWGFLSLFLFYFIHPSISQFVSLIISKTSFYLPLVIFIYFLIDFIFTLTSLFDFRKISKNLQSLKEHYKDRLEDFEKEQIKIFNNFKNKHKHFFNAFPNIKLKFKI